MLQTTLILGIGLLSGFLGATVGSGGMISIPALLLLGFSPQVSIASNSAGDIGAFLAAVYEYTKSKKIYWELSAVLIVVAIITSSIGAFILLALPTDFLKKLIGFFLLLFLPIIFIQKSSIQTPSQSKKTLGYILYGIVDTVGAITGGAGQASLELLITMICFRLPIVRAYATICIPELCIVVLLTIIYGWHGLVNWPLAILLFIGNLIGGIIGAKLAIAKGNIYIKWLFVMIIITSAIKILFFS